MCLETESFKCNTSIAGDKSLVPVALTSNMSLLFHDYVPVPIHLCQLLVPLLV